MSTPPNHAMQPTQHFVKVRELQRFVVKLLGG
jgi:hypothetical protein